MNMKRMLSLITLLMAMIPSLFANDKIIIIDNNPLIEKFVCKARDRETKNPEFRKAIEQIGALMASRVACDMKTKNVEVITVLDSKAKHKILDEDVVILTNIRAGIPMLNGMLKVIPEANCGFFGIERNAVTKKADITYVGIPNLKDKSIIFVDPMIATGSSIDTALAVVMEHKPKKICVVGVLATKQGIKKIHARDENIMIYIASIEEKRNEKGFVIPGLGDAGDRSYGTKL